MKPLADIVEISHKVGFLYRPTFISGIDHFEVFMVDDEKKEVHSHVIPKQGLPFNDVNPFTSYDKAFQTGEYMPLAIVIR